VLFNNHIELRTAENLVVGVGTVLVTHSILLLLLLLLSGIIAEII